MAAIVYTNMQAADFSDASFAFVARLRKARSCRSLPSSTCYRFFERESIVTMLTVLKKLVEVISKPALIMFTLSGPYEASLALPA